MFTYFHCYMPETWQAQIDAGFVGKNDGIRFVQYVRQPEDDFMNFNNVAKKGGDLYNYLKENKCPFYIDRLQGGGLFSLYDYDWDLVNEYKSLLGDKFYGFQMHEWNTNYINDIIRIKNCLGEEKAWTAENIVAALKEKFPQTAVPFLEVQDEFDFEKFGCPKNFDELMAELKRLYLTRQELTGDTLIPCDSFIAQQHDEAEWGTKRYFCECGEQTSYMNMQMAFARGVSREKNIDFGVYVEPWRTVEGIGTKCTNFQKDGKNEWFNADIGESYTAAGENAGFSRSIQKRMQYYGYLAGAKFMSEEHGMRNVFYDWKDFQITPYGQVKLDFLKFTRKYTEIGEQYTPIAVVIPKEIPFVEFPELEKWQPNWHKNFPASEELETKMKQVKESLYKIFATSHPMVGNENICLKNPVLPDAMDIVIEGYETINNYEYLVDLTFNPKLAKNHNNIISIDEISDKLKEILPCSVTGNAHWFVNKIDDGFYLSIFNNNGIVRDIEKGDVYLEEGKAEITITLNDDKILEALEGNTNIEKTGNTYKVTLNSGDWLFARF